MRLSLLCITRVEPHAPPFLNEMSALAKQLHAEFVLCADTYPDHPVVSEMGWTNGAPKVHFVRSEGYLESVHDAMLEHCHGDYVLRLDDDETCSPALIDWLKRGKYAEKDHWKFARAHLFGNERDVLLTPELWPDHQTRLSVRAKAGGRNQIHCGSPFGGGDLAPAALVHHKFLVKTVEERRRIVENYNRVQAGAGTAFLAFSVPEDAYKGQTVRVVPINDGDLTTGHFSQKECGGCGKWVKL